MLVSGLALTGCGATQSTSPKPRAANEPQELPRVVVTPEEVTDIPTLHARAVELAKSGRHLEAARAFDRVVALDPGGSLAADALFRAGAQYDLGGELATAALRYEDGFRRYPDSSFARLSLARGVRVLTHLEEWERAGVLARRMLSFESELGPFDRITAYSAAALDSLARDDERGASTFIERGRTLVDERGLDAAGRIPRELGALYFALGELRRRRAERIRFEPFPPNFGVVMEQRCQLLLDAQSAYSDAMRAHDAHWSTMAGVRVGELYQGLHRDLMQIRTPPSADTEEKRRLFEGALRLRYAVLLETSLKMLDHTLTMAERTGERSAWVERGKAVRAAVDAEVRAEQEAIARLPYSKATLQQALDELGRRHAGGQ